MKVSSLVRLKKDSDAKLWQLNDNTKVIVNVFSLISEKQGLEQVYSFPPLYQHSSSVLVKVRFSHSAN